MARAVAESRDQHPYSFIGQARTEVLGLSLNRAPGPWVQVQMEAPGETYGGH